MQGHHPVISGPLADLTPVLQVLLSGGSTVVSLHSRQSFSISFFHLSLGLPGPYLPSTCISHAVLTAPLEHSTCPNQGSHLSLSKPQAQACPYCGHILWFDTADLSDHGRNAASSSTLGQWPSCTGMEHGAHRKELYYGHGSCKRGGRM